MEKKIYNLNGSNIEVYSIDTIPHKMKLFRQSELDSLLRSEQILRKDENIGWFTPRKGVIYECDAYVLRMIQKPKRDEASEMQRVRLAYVDGYYRSDPVFAQDNLITLSPEDDTTNRRVNLTMNAYLAYLLDNGIFDSPLLQIENLEKVKEILKISNTPIAELSIDEMRKLYESELVDFNFDERMEYVEATSKVLRKIR